MQTITDKLQILKDNTESIRQALSDKAGYDVGPMLKDYSEIISSITGGTLGESNVNFYDYDGTVLYSYSKDKFLKLNSLPELPSHDGLICQGWNYNLENAKAYVEKYGKLDVGATYITDDGCTRLYIKLENDGLEIPLYINQTVENGVRVDWGDGNSETISGTGNVIFNHIYDKSGSYTISLKVESGTCTLGHNDNVMGNFDTVASGSLYKVEVGSNMSIGTYTFERCHSLTSIVLPEGVTSIDAYAFYYCFSLTSINIPNGVTSIGDYAFNSCHSLTSIVLPEGVTSIGSNTFSVCTSLTSIVLPEGVTSIGLSEFYNCYSLTSIVLPEGVTSIGKYAFYYCYSLTSIVLPENLTSIGNSAFSSCYSLTSIVLPEGVTSIGDYTFQNCTSLTSIVLPEGVTSIGDYAFRYCYSLTSIVLPESVTSIGNYTFTSCYSLTSIVLPESVTSIGDYAFQNCYSLTSINIPNSVASINQYAFNNCYSLTSINIPNSVTSIGKYAFSYCSSMQYYDFTSHTSIPTLSNTNAFSYISAGCEIRAPYSLYEEWKAATNWATYADYIVPYDEEGNKVISFTITGDRYGTTKSYQAYEGMTWSEWISSGEFDIANPESASHNIGLAKIASLAPTYGNEDDIMTHGLVSIYEDIWDPQNLIYIGSYVYQFGNMIIIDGGDYRFNQQK